MKSSKWPDKTTPSPQVYQLRQLLLQPFLFLLAVAWSLPRTWHRKAFHFSSSCGNRQHWTYVSRLHREVALSDEIVNSRVSECVCIDVNVWYQQRISSLSHRFVVSNPNIAKLAMKFSLTDPILGHLMLVPERKSSQLAITNTQIRSSLAFPKEFQQLC